MYIYISSVAFILGICAAYERSYSPASPLFTHETGYVWDITEWRTDTTQTPAAYLCIGPDATDAPQGYDILVYFSLAVDNNSADDLELLDLSVYEASSGEVIVNRTVHRNDFETAGVIQNFSLFFTTPVSPSRLQYRVYYRCCSEITLSLISVRSLSDSGPMAPFWNDTASWMFVSKSIFPSPDGANWRVISLQLPPKTSSFLMQANTPRTSASILFRLAIRGSYFTVSTPLG